jgi:hypothetical protein
VVDTGFDNFFALRGVSVAGAELRYDPRAPVGLVCVKGSPVLSIENEVAAVAIESTIFETRRVPVPNVDFGPFVGTVGRTKVVAPIWFRFLSLAGDLCAVLIATSILLVCRTSEFLEVASGSGTGERA